MSEPPSPRSTLTIHRKHHRNASFSVRSDTDDDVDKSARKFFTTWRTACDKTKDKTRELLKRTLSWKGQDYSVPAELTVSQEETKARMSNTSQRGWSVHIWSKLRIFLLYICWVIIFFIFQLLLIRFVVKLIGCESFLYFFFFFSNKLLMIIFSTYNFRDKIIFCN